MAHIPQLLANQCRFIFPVAAINPELKTNYHILYRFGKKKNWKQKKKQKTGQVSQIKTGQSVTAGNSPVQTARRDKAYGLKFAKAKKSFERERKKDLRRMYLLLEHFYNQLASFEFPTTN